MLIATLKQGGAGRGPFFDARPVTPGTPAEASQAVRASPSGLSNTWITCETHLWDGVSAGASSCWTASRFYDAAAYHAVLRHTTKNGQRLASGDGRDEPKGRSDGVASPAEVEALLRLAEGRTPFGQSRLALYHEDGLRLPGVGLP